MGCASSSPLITANGEVLNAAKGAATDAVHAGEEALNDVKGSLNDTVTDTVGHVKEAVVGAVSNVGNAIENAFNGGKKEQPSTEMNDITTDKLQLPETNTEENFKIIPLKDPSERLMQNAMKEIEDNVVEKANNYKDETEKLADDLIKETEDVVTQSVEEATDKATDTVKKLVHSSSVHSIDSLKTNSPEPEIEKALANDIPTGPPTPKPTLAELEELHSAASSVISQVTAIQQMQNAPTTAVDSTTDSKNNSSENHQQHQPPPPENNTINKIESIIQESSTKIILQEIIGNEEETKNNSDENEQKIDQNYGNTDDVFLTPEIIPNEPTAWEVLADDVTKSPPNLLQAYREGINTDRQSSAQRFMDATKHVEH